MGACGGLLLEVNIQANITSVFSLFNHPILDNLHNIVNFGGNGSRQRECGGVMEVIHRCRYILSLSLSLSLALSLSLSLW